MKTSAFITVSGDYRERVEGGGGSADNTQRMLRNGVVLLGKNAESSPDSANLAGRTAPE